MLRSLFGWNPRTSKDKFFTKTTQEQSGLNKENPCKLRINPIPIDFPTDYHPSDTNDTDSICDNLCVKNVETLIEINGRTHRTSQYDRMSREDKEQRLVIRRGQEFSLKLYFNRTYNKNIDAIAVVLTLDGVDPSLKHHTLVTVPLSQDEDGKEGNWHASLSYEEEMSAIIKIVSPADVMIGKWNIEINTKNKKLPSTYNRYRVPNPIYIIFNPWCTDDDVFIENKYQCQEYVLADIGYIWRNDINEPAFWHYSQFKENILDCALYLITDIAKVGVAHRNNTVKITRKLSAALNANDSDNGVLTGKWDGKYSDGIAPWQWTGSADILQKYFSTKKSVSYGQCWVFAGVLATVYRALGLPSRVVTNYHSAHDTEGSLTIDHFFDDDAENVEISKDSIWNFHVWNEVWMNRPDIGDGLYDGWQVVDATPQERSEGVYCCGPMSVTAIKNGDILQPYDGKFIYAEVNADEVYWKYNGPKEPLKFIRQYVDSIGIDISTKAVGRWDREDITHTYKEFDGSEKERTISEKVLKLNTHDYSRYYINEGFTDLYFDFKICKSRPITATPYTAMLIIENRNIEKEYKVSIVCRKELRHYTGKKLGDSKKILDAEHTIQPGATKVLYVDIQKYSDNHKLSDYCNVSLKCLAKVHGTNYEFLAKKKLDFERPHIEILKTEDAIVGRKMNITARFTNHLKTNLPSAQFIIDTVGFDKDTIKFKTTNVIKPGRSTFCTFSIIPKYEGHGVIVAKFVSGQLGVHHSSITFDILPAFINNNNDNNTNNNV